MFDHTKRMLKNIKRLNELLPTIDRMQDELDALRSRIDVGDELFELFQRERDSNVYRAVYEKTDPLVSVCIGTYNRAQLLTERSLRSVLEQDYANLEVVVVGDGCTDDTVSRMGKIRDTRLRFVNLERRGAYPEQPEFRWMVAGTVPFNHALELAQGDLITHLDDDDAFLPDRISRLVAYLQDKRADIVWHPFLNENSDGSWNPYEAIEYKRTQVTTSCVLYHSWFKRIPWDMNAYKYREPGDWNRFRKFKYLGARIERYPVPLLKHYRERNQS